MAVIKVLSKSPVLLYSLMILLGAYAGLCDVPGLKQSGLVLSEIFVRLFQCVSLPIISLSIVVTLLNYNTEAFMKKVWSKTLLYTLTTTLVAASISFVLYILISPDMMNTGITATSAPVPNSYVKHLSQLIPSDLLTPFIQHQVLTVLLLSLALGLGIRQIPDAQSRQVIAQFFKGMHGLFMVLTQWIIKVIPLGLFGFITATISQLQHAQALKGLGEYLLVIVLANLVQGLLVLPLWLKYRGMSPLKAMKAMMPALSLAFFSKSSVGTLPVTMETIEKNQGVKPEISRFVLPLCTSINMNGCAAFIFVTVSYIMQNQGIELSLPMMMVWVGVATLAAIGNAGVPMGCYFLSASLLSSMNVSIALMGVILPFYALIDMLETSLNVWSDACVTMAVDQETEKSTEPSLVDVAIYP